MGYASNVEPSFIIPSSIAVDQNENSNTIRSRPGGVDDLDFYIGNEVRKNEEKSKE